jgi:hypothetical protein
MAAKRAIAVFRAPKPIDKLIFKVRALIINLLLNPGYFAAIVPLPATVTGNVDTLETKQGRVVAKIVGAASLRNIILALVKTNINDLVAAVQSLADNSANLATAIAIIQAAGLEVKVNGVRVKAPFSAKCRAGFSGVAFLVMKAVHLASYDWQVSYDKGMTWVPLPGSRNASTTLEGLTLGAQLMFRGRANVGNVAGVGFPADLIVS